MSDNRLLDVEKQVSHLNSVVERIDITLTKLTDLSTTVSQILAVQGNRLEVQEKAGDKLERLVETRRLEQERSIKELNSKMDDIEKDFKENLDNHHEKIIEKIDELRISDNKQHKELDARMSRIERWMWILVGAGVVITFILNKINLLSLFT